MRTLMLVLLVTTVLVQNGEYFARDVDPFTFAACLRLGSLSRRLCLAHSRSWKLCVQGFPQDEWGEEKEREGVAIHPLYTFLLVSVILLLSTAFETIKGVQCLCVRSRPRCVLIGGMTAGHLWCVNGSNR